MKKPIRRLLKKKSVPKSKPGKMIVVPTVTVSVESIDIKSFRSLMGKHNIKIVVEKEIEESPAFVVESNETEIEDLLVSTNMAWEFA